MQLYMHSRYNTNSYRANPLIYLYVSIYASIYLSIHLIYMYIYTYTYIYIISYIYIGLTRLCVLPFPGELRRACRLSLPERGRATCRRRERRANQLRNAHPRAKEGQTARARLAQSARARGRIRPAARDAHGDARRDDAALRALRQAQRRNGGGHYAPAARSLAAAVRWHVPAAPAYGARLPDPLRV